MNKKVLITAGAILLLIVLILTIWLATRRDGQEEERTAESEIIKLSQLPGGWRLVEHPVYDISFELPQAWEIMVFENGKGKVEATFLAAGASAFVDINKEDNVNGFTPEQLLDRNKNNQVTEIHRDSVKGISYVTRVGSEHESGFINDSYLLINKYFLADNILTISCGLSGPNYKLMIPTCEEIVRSLKFIK